MEIIKVNSKATYYIFKGRNQKEAQNKMNKFLKVARITGRFLCVDSRYELTTTDKETKSPIEQILESAMTNNQRRF